MSAELIDEIDEEESDSPELKLEFQYELTTPIRYAYRGDKVDARFITLLAPTSRNMKECAKIKQAFVRALRANISTSSEEENNSDEEEKGGLADITGPEIMGVIAASAVVELDEVLEVAKRLFVSGIAMVEGETRLTSSLADKLSMDDFEAMVGEYIVNFTAPSLLDATKDRSSRESSTS